MRWIAVTAVSVVVATGCGADDEVAATPTTTVLLAEGEVSADDIIFDTFDGGSVSLSDADEATIARLLDAIPPIDDPAYESVDEADWLVGDDVVLGYIDLNGEAWAFPVKILDLHEIVNDEIAGRPLILLLCGLRRQRKDAVPRR